MWQSMQEHVEVVGFFLLAVAAWAWRSQVKKLENLESRVTDIEHNYIDRFEKVTKEVRDSKEAVVGKISELHVHISDKFVRKGECAKFSGEKEPFTE